MRAPETCSTQAAWPVPAPAPLSAVTVGHRVYTAGFAGDELIEAGGVGVVVGEVADDRCRDVVPDGVALDAAAADAAVDGEGGAVRQGGDGGRIGGGGIADDR